MASGNETASASSANGVGGKGGDGGPLAQGGESGAQAPRGRTRVVAVTGAASFLGTNLIGLLEEDEHVDRIVAVDVKAPSTAGPKTRSYEVDFTQPTTEARLAEILAAERADTVVHLAFLASPSHATAWAHELESVGTMHVLVAARHAQVRKFVMWSQTMLYGAHPNNPNFLAERHPLRSSSREPFFADKVEAEKEAQKFAQRSQGSVVTILRTAPILGPTVRNYLTRYLSRRLVPTMMGFDPLGAWSTKAACVTWPVTGFREGVPGRATTTTGPLKASCDAA